MSTKLEPSDSEVKTAVANILKQALLRIRIEASVASNKSCEIEADHVHNLPDLLINYSDELLKFYYDIERTSYLRECKENYPSQYDGDWNTLARRLNKLNK